MKNIYLFVVITCCICCRSKNKVNVSLHKIKAIASDIKILKEMQIRDSIAGDDDVNAVLQSNTISAIDEITSNTYSVNGYFFKDSIPILLSDLKWTQVNTPIPDSVYIKLDNDYVTQSGKSLDSLQGSFISCLGKLNTIAKNNKLNGAIEIGSNVDVSLTLIESPGIVTKNEHGFKIPSIVNLCSVSPIFCTNTVSTVSTKNYALLYAGGIQPLMAYPRYWNDLKFMYNTLKYQYGYSDDEIVVAFKDGKPLDHDMPVDYAASEKGFADAISYLSKKLDSQTDLLIFVTNHGGGYLEKDDGGIKAGNYGGIPKTDVTLNIVDQTTFYYMQPNNVLSGMEFSSKINSLHFRKMVGIFEQCFGGGFLNYLKGDNRILISAASDAQFSHAASNGNFDLFSYFFTYALNRGIYNGVGADLNNDGNISFLEAFLFAQKNDSEINETPLLEDNGDGKGSNIPQQIKGKDGYLAGNTFLVKNFPSTNNLKKTKQKKIK